MPTQFDPFKFINLYPSCPLPENAVGWNSGFVSETTLSDINVGVPLFWLLKSIRFSGDWDFTISGGGLSESFQNTQSFDVTIDTDFLATLPNKRMCVNPAIDGAVSIADDPDVFNSVRHYFYPFGENNLHFSIDADFEEGFDPISAGVFVLISSYEQETTSDAARYEWKEVSIPANPYDITGTLYAGVYIVEQIYTITGTWDVSLNSMEFWT